MGVLPKFLAISGEKYPNKHPKNKAIMTWVNKEFLINFIN
jgi:hypothetical protein